VPKIANCPGCPYAGKAVGTRGDPSSRIVLVGEPPGKNEIDAGEPFVRQPRRAGGVLWDALDEVHLGEDDVFITNAVACQPHPVKPKVAAINACRARLIRDIEQAPRTVIVTLGATAFRGVTDQRGFLMRDIRGKPVESRWGTLVPTLHPARVLRVRDEHRYLVDDLRLAIGIAASVDEV
jgi:uracil-DNA glycosylase